MEDIEKLKNELLEKKVRELMENEGKLNEEICDLKTDKKKLEEQKKKL